jgi:hypothetical protein
MNLMMMPFNCSSRNKNELFALFFSSIQKRYPSSEIIGMSGREEEDEGAGAGCTATRQEGGIKRVSRLSEKAREGMKIADTSQQRVKRYRANKLARSPRSAQLPRSPTHLSRHSMGFAAKSLKPSL